MLVRLVLSIMLVSTPASSHSWYPHKCCSGEDCYPVPVKDVKSVSGGWIVEGRDFVPYNMAQPSEDGDFHVCRRDKGKGELIKIEGEPYCFWAPAGAS